MGQRDIQITNQYGFSLLEVIIAMLILAMGGGGLALLLMASVQGTAQAQERSMATLQASELAQLIHANPASLGHFMYAVGNPPDCSDDLPCPANSWAGSQLQQWQQALEQSVHQAHGVVCQDSSPLDGEPDELDCDGTGDAWVKIVWQDQARGQQLPQTRRWVLPLPRP